MQQHNNTELLLEALEMAIGLRGEHPGLIHHSDQGRPYAAKAYRQRLAEVQIRPSVSRRGNCWDNAPMERFFRSLKTEWVPEMGYRSFAEVQRSIFN